MRGVLGVIRIVFLRLGAEPPGGERPASEATWLGVRREADRRRDRCQPLGAFSKRSVSRRNNIVKLRITGAGLTLAMLAMTGYPAFAGVAAPMPAVKVETRPGSSLVPEDFKVPILVEAPGFKLVPLGPDLVKVDFDAYMSSVEHLQKTFTRSTGWPHENISDADAMRD